MMYRLLIRTSQLHWLCHKASPCMGIVNPLTNKNKATEVKKPLPVLQLN